RLTDPLLVVSLLGDVAADKEILVLRRRPHAGPPQRDDAPAFVDITAFEIAHHTAVARLPHLLARTVQILVVEELAGTAPRHLGRIVAEDRRRAGADADQHAVTVDD